MSTLLASIYLANMEKDILSVLPDELMMRRTDDYIFVTPHLSRAEYFLLSMLNGWFM